MKKNFAKKIFSVYQLIMTFVILPWAYFLWLEKFDNRHDITLMLFSIPVLFGYVVPGLGTNYMKLWEFKAGIKIGRYTLLHGLMFGGASTFLAYLCCDILLQGSGLFQIVLSFHVLAAVLGFWNWIFDTIAIKNGVAVIYNKPYTLHQSAETIVADYAPIYFGLFGGCFGIQVHLIYTWSLSFKSIQYWKVLVLFNLVTFFIPVLGHCVSSKIKHGYWGLRPYQIKEE